MKSVENSVSATSLLLATIRVYNIRRARINTNKLNLLPITFNKPYYREIGIIFADMTKPRSTTIEKYRSVTEAFLDRTT